MLQGASHHVGESTLLERAAATPASPLHSSPSPCRVRAWLAAVAGHAWYDSVGWVLAHLPGGLWHSRAYFSKLRKPCPFHLVKVRTCFPWCSGPFHLFSLKLYPLPFPAMQLLAELHCWVQWTFLDLSLKGTIFSLSVFQAASMFYSLTILFFSLKF